MVSRANVCRRSVAVAVAVCLWGAVGFGAGPRLGAVRVDRPEAANAEPPGGSSQPTSDPVLAASMSG